MQIVVVHTMSGYFGKGSSISEALRNAGTSINDRCVISIYEVPHEKDVIIVGGYVEYNGEELAQLGPDSFKHAFKHRSLFEKVANILSENGYDFLADELEDAYFKLHDDE